MRTGFDDDVRAGVPRTQPCLQRLARRCVHDIESRTGRAREEAGALHGIGLDEWRSRCVPGAQAAAPLGVGLHLALAQNPGRFDIFGMRAHHAAIRGCGFAQPKQKAVVDVRQAEPRAFTTAIVHEDLERRRAELPRVARHAGKLLLGRDDEVIAEVDTSAGFGHGPHLVEDRLERLGRHQIGDERRDRRRAPPRRSRCAASSGTRGRAMSLP